MKLKKIAILFIIALFFSGCEQKEKLNEKTQTHSHSMGKNADITLCGNCGQVKGSDICCKVDAVKCGCGAHKGSPACCTITLTGENITLCGHCGEVRGSELCCLETAEKCVKCDKIKDSPGCCLHTHTHS